MNENNFEYRTQSIDYLGFLSTELRNLRGFATLANELIQNADDAPLVTSLSFDICEDALIVENNGKFRPEDFERMQNIAAGGKREEAGTTGAFGIGFISVYLITDEPEIISSGQHWIFSPANSEDKRIKVAQTKESSGTKFRLPWAKNESEVRRKLRVEIISNQSIEKFVQEVAEALPKTILFLRKLELIELKRNGQLIKRIQRTVNLNLVTVQITSQSDKVTQQVWHLFKGNFEREATNLQQQFPGNIELKRGADVTVAIPEQGQDVRGLLYAFLPTQHETGLPFHINADFYPSSDRKRILFEGDYQDKWNRAALSAAAKVIASNVERLKDILKHRFLWKIINKIYSHLNNSVLNIFWSTLKPIIEQKALIWTSKQEWRSPKQVCLLEAEEEQEALPVLEKAIQKISRSSIVHPDLHSYSSLLEKVGVLLFDTSMLVDALSEWGLNDSIPIEQAPEWIRSAENRAILGKEIGILVKRWSSNKVLLKQQAIALGNDNQLHPPRKLWKANEEIAKLFSSLGVPRIFLASGNHVKISELVPDFSIPDAIQSLKETPLAALETKWKRNRKILHELFQYLENNQEKIRNNEQQQALKLSRIFPSSDKLQSLEGLAMPGFFEDNLHLASLVDIEAIGGHKDFLRNVLGVQELTFTVYAQEHIPRAFKNHVTPESCRQLVSQIATKIGEIRSNTNIKSALVKCPMIECKKADGSTGFLTANQVYLDIEPVVSILGSRKPLAILPTAQREEIRDLYLWLGVADKPRSTDLLELIQETVAHYPSPKGEVRERMQKIFKHLGNRWKEEGDSLGQTLQELKSYPWLPADGDETKWYQPNEIFTNFHRLSFETQGNFLDVDETKATEFIRFLEIKSKPTTQQVIAHLLECSAQKIEVSFKVYEFLQNCVDDPNLETLKDKACIYLEKGQYVRPDRAFWSEHSFGNYRHSLPNQLSNYSELFKNLGVQEKPQSRDAIYVLQEISRKFGNPEQQMHDEAYKIVLECWKFLSRDLEKGAISDRDIKEALGSQKVIPNQKRVLVIPNLIFFEDRPNLIDKFSVLQNNDHVLSRQELTGASWKAMQVAGINPLSKVIRAQIVNCSAPKSDIGRDGVLESWLRYYRKSLISRVTLGQHPATSYQWNLGILAKLKVKQAGEIEIRYSLEAHPTFASAEPFNQKTQSYFDNDKCILYYCEQNLDIPWALLARELAYALNSDVEVGQIASGIKEVISADSRDEAKKRLDDLGYAPYPDSEPLPSEPEPRLPQYSSYSGLQLTPTSNVSEHFTLYDDGTSDNAKLWGQVGEEWGQSFYQWLGYNKVRKQPNVQGYDFLCTEPKEPELTDEIKAEVKAITFSRPTIRMTINEWSRMMQLQNQDKYELLIVTHASSYEQKFNSVRKIIRVRKFWQTLTDIFCQIDRQKVIDAKYGSGIIEFLIGLQQSNSEYFNKDNHILIHWKRLIESVPHPNIEIYEPLFKDNFIKN